MKARVTAKQTTFMTAPTLNMSIVRRPLGSKAIALGGVETGSIKEKEVTSVVGNIKSKGLVFVVRANSAMIGMRMEAEAELEATCVSTEAIPQAIMRMANDESPSMAYRHSSS